MPRLSLSLLNVTPSVDHLTLCPVVSSRRLRVQPHTGNAAQQMCVECLNSGIAYTHQDSQYKKISRVLYTLVGYTREVGKWSLYLSSPLQSFWSG